jgi:hypothetical protein
MNADDDNTILSTKINEFLNRRLMESQLSIKKLKRKRTVYKILFITTTGSSIIIAVTLAGISALTVPPMVIPILSITSGILTGLSAKFGFQDKKEQLNKEIRNLHKIQNTFDYVISCNGDMTKQKFQEIISEFDSAI